MLWFDLIDDFSFLAFIRLTASPLSFYEIGKKSNFVRWLWVEFKVTRLPFMFAFMAVPWFHRWRPVGSTATNINISTNGSFQLQQQSWRSKHIRQCGRRLIRGLFNTQPFTIRLQALKIQGIPTPRPELVVDIRTAAQERRVNFLETLPQHQHIFKIRCIWPHTREHFLFN